MTAHHSYDLSVIVACPDPGSTLAGCVDALSLACKEVAAEIIVIDATLDCASWELGASHPNLRVERMPPGTLTPLLWSRGLTRARGRVVAFTIAQCHVAPTWARALLDGMTEGTSGVAGGLEIGPRATVRDWAVFYLRYAAFIAPRLGKATSIELPGDNAAYRRDALLRHAASFANGFWEIDFHRRLRDEGESLAFVSGATATLEASADVRLTLSNRLTHGKHFGAWRVATRGWSPWRVMLAAPLVPAILSIRIARRVLPHRPHRLRLLLSLPYLALFALAWALGEALGALSQTTSRQFKEAAA